MFYIDYAQHYTLDCHQQIIIDSETIVIMFAAKKGKRSL